MVHAVQKVKPLQGFAGIGLKKKTNYEKWAKYERAEISENPLCKNIYSC